MCVCSNLLCLLIWPYVVEPFRAKSTQPHFHTCSSIVWEDSTGSFHQKTHIFRCNLRGKVGRRMEHMGRHLSFYLHGELDSLKIVTAINMAFEVRRRRLPLLFSYQGESRTFHWRVMFKRCFKSHYWASRQAAGEWRIDLWSPNNLPRFTYALIIGTISMKTWYYLTKVISDVFGG